MLLNKKISLLSIGFALSPSNVMAEESNLEIEKIIVTAQKRQQNLQEVPISVATFNHDDLKQAGIVTISDLANITPGLTITNTQSEETAISMRGIGSNDFGFSSDESIPIYLDGVYLGTGVSTLGDLTDISQIEVLKGPQGTLFGRNAIGGAVNITTAQPTSEQEAHFTVGYGVYGLKTQTGMVNIPLIDDELMLRVTGNVRTRNGWQNNEATNITDGYAQDRWNTRAKLLWAPTESLSITLTLDTNEENDHSGYSNVKGGDVANLLAQYGLLSDSSQDITGTKV
ncbi:TonB-dependent receptor [Shewanella frigidimarina]|uniref:TonB-dependent receptor n=1 Tax=Shewanella frigidimarina TaxID=56812 RepID=UPI003D7AF298